jgi:hypothetical protein
MVNPSTLSDDHEAKLAAMSGAQTEDQPDDEYYYDDTRTDTIPDPFLFGDPDLLKLGIALGFGPDELASNREGYITPAQIKPLERDLRWKYWPLIIFTAVLGFSIASVGIFTAPGGLVAFLPALLLFGASALMAFFVKRERESLPDRLVDSTVLEVGWIGLALRRWGVTGSENGKAHFTGVGGQKLFAQKGVHNAMHANQIYRAYYVPGISWTRVRILSLEPIGERSKRGEIGNRKVKTKNTS